MAETINLNKPLGNNIQFSMIGVLHMGFSEKKQTLGSELRDTVDKGLTVGSVCC